MKRMRSMNPVLRVRIGVALAVPLFAASPSVGAWGPSAFYPTPVEPLMPGPERAQELRVETPGVLKPLGHAHWQSARRGWTGVPVREGDNLPDLGTSASGTPDPWR
jgi:hypothetical protein